VGEVLASKRFRISGGQN